MTVRINIPQLRRLHAAPKNLPETLRMVTPAQLAEYYALHDAFPALVEAVEAARLSFESFAETERCQCARCIRLRDALARFDFDPPQPKEQT